MSPEPYPGCEGHLDPWGEVVTSGPQTRASNTELLSMCDSLFPRIPP